MPIPPKEYPPLESVGALEPLENLPDAKPRGGKAPWPIATDLTDLRTQASPLWFGGGVFGRGMYNDDALIKSNSAVRALRLAFRYGINTLDTSPYYYPSELVLGRALRMLASEYPRSSYFLITKCGRYGPARSQFDYSPETVTQSVHDSLERLGTTYVDAALLHDTEFVSDQPRIAQLPEGTALAAQAVGAPCKAKDTRTKDEALEALGLAPHDAGRVRGDGDRRILAAVRALFALKDQGKVRNVGISGYPLGEQLRISRLVACNEPYRPLDVILNYSNHTLHADLLPLWRPLFEACPWTTAPDGAQWQAPMLVNASPFSMGLFSDRGPPGWHPASDELLEAVRLAHSRAQHAAGVTDVAPVTPDNVLGFTALLNGLRGAAGEPRFPTLLGMSTVEEVHMAIEAYRALAAGLGRDADLLAKDTLETYETLYHQLASFEGMVHQTLQGAGVQHLCWPSPAPDA